MVGEQITRRELIAFPRPVQDAVMHLVNDHDVRYRMTDGAHVLLYGPDGSSHKAGRSRKPEASVKHLTKWAHELGCEHL